MSNPFPFFLSSSPLFTSRPTVDSQWIILIQISMLLTHFLSWFHIIKVLFFISIKILTRFTSFTKGCPLIYSHERFPFSFSLYRENLPNNSLYFGSFKPEEYSPTVHNGQYRVMVSNPVGTLISSIFSVRASKSILYTKSNLI